MKAVCMLIVMLFVLAIPVPAFAEGDPSREDNPFYDEDKMEKEIEQASWFERMMANPLDTILLIITDLFRLSSIEELVFDAYERWDVEEPEAEIAPGDSVEVPLPADSLLEEYEGIQVVVKDSDGIVHESPRMVDEYFDEYGAEEVVEMEEALKQENGTWLYSWETGEQEKAYKIFAYTADYKGPDNIPYGFEEEYELATVTVGGVEKGSIVVGSEMERYEGRRPERPEVGGIFYQHEWDGYITSLYNVFLALAFVMMATSIAYSGMKMAGMSGTPHGRMQAQDSALNWVITVLILGLLPTVTLLLFELNEAFVESIRGMTPLSPDNGELKTPVLAHTYTGHWFTTWLIKLVMILLTVYFNILYIIRRYVILALFVISPLVAWAWGKGRQQTAYLWGAEMIGNVFMQTVHALSFMLFFWMVQVGGLTWFEQFILFMFVVGISVLLRKLIAAWLSILTLNEEQQASGLMGGVAGGALSITGIASVGKIAGQGLMGGGSSGAAPSGTAAAASAGKFGGFGGAGAGALGAAAGPIGAGLGIAGAAAGAGVSLASKLTSSAIGSGSMGSEGSRLGQGLMAGGASLTGKSLGMMKPPAPGRAQSKPQVSYSKGYGGGY